MSTKQLQVKKLPAKVVEQKIYIIRNQKVMLDHDLAQLYGVDTFRLNEAVKRNKRRFPPDFMFQLTSQENSLLTSQIAISKKGRGGRRTSPFVFTEQGVAMLSSVLNSERAIQVNIAIMRTFVELRHLGAFNSELAHRIDELEKGLIKHDTEIETIFRALRKLIDERKEPPPSKHHIGFSI